MILAYFMWYTTTGNSQKDRRLGRQKKAENTDGIVTYLSFFAQKGLYRLTGTHKCWQLMTGVLTVDERSSASQKGHLNWPAPHYYETSGYPFVPSVPDGIYFLEKVAQYTIYFVKASRLKTHFFLKEKFFRLWLTTNDFFHEVNWHLKNAGKFN